MNITDKVAQTSSRIYSQDGYLIVPAKLSKIGVFDYLAHELGEGGYEVKKVKRSEASLFSDETINSFEGVPITLGHPKENVTSKNWKSLAVGNVRNVKREGDYLVGEAWVYDENAIQTIEKYGIEEVSCGYQSEIKALDDSVEADYELLPMLGNHVALVANGRCGSTCKLADEEISIMTKVRQFLDSFLGNFGIKLTDEQAKKLDEEIDKEEKKDEEKNTSTSDKKDDDKTKKADESEEKKKDEASDKDKKTDEAKGDADDLEALEIENKQLKAKLDKVQDEFKKYQDRSKLDLALIDAQAVFKDIDFKDANTVRHVHEKVILTTNLIDANGLLNMSDEAVSGLYFAAKRIKSLERSQKIGEALLSDSNAVVVNNLNRYKDN